MTFRNAFLFTSLIVVGPVLAGSIGCEGPVPEVRETSGTAAVQTDQALPAAGGDSKAPSMSAARELLSYLEEGAYTEAAERFHYPPSYSVEERARDVALVKASLEVLLRRLGPIHQVEDGSEEPPIAHVGIGGGTGEYWQHCEGSALLPFRVEFQNLTQGVALVRMCRIGGEWRVQALHLGGRVASPEVQAMLAGARHEIAALFQQQ
jgi:hypothetical protein